MDRTRVPSSPRVPEYHFPATTELERRLRLAKLNTDVGLVIATRWGIRSIPTLILFRHGAELQRGAGALSLPQLRQWLAQSVAA